MTLDKVAEVVIIFFWLMFLVMLVLPRNSFIKWFSILLFLNKERRPEVEHQS